MSPGNAQADNAAAQQLYTREGYLLEAQEEAWQAAQLGRPRRLLLRKQLLGAATAMGQAAAEEAPGG